ncbi:hypothetical protein JHK85_045204 [Glycine max]|nr:hypothetical protein JHK85_045204 [Glycine max]
MENNGGFKVLVYPNVDCAFIVALLMIINDIKNYDALVNAAWDIILTVATGGMVTYFMGGNSEEETLDGENNPEGENLEVENNFEAET